MKATEKRLNAKRMAADDMLLDTMNPSQSVGFAANVFGAVGMREGDFAEDWD